MNPTTFSTTTLDDARPRKRRRASCFVGETMLDTTWGRCRMSDLARLATAARSAKTRLTSLVSNTQAEIANLQAMVDACAADIAALDGVPNSAAQVEQLVDASNQCTNQIDVLNAALVQYQTKLDELPTRLPNARVRDPQTGEVVERTILDVWHVTDTTDLRDVTFDGQGNKVRVTPDHMFVTTSGDTAVADLVSNASTVYLIDVDGVSVSTFAALSVETPTVDNPVAVYDAQIDGIAGYAVAPDGSSPAVCVVAHIP